jgi:hypothetical protein
VFWILTPCGIAGRYRSFEEICCLHFQGSRIRFKFDTEVDKHNETAPLYRQVEEGQGIVKQECNKAGSRTSGNIGTA